MLRSLGRQSEQLANNYISSVSTATRIRQQLWFNHRCKDQGLIPAGLKVSVEHTRGHPDCQIHQDSTTATTNYNNNLTNLNNCYRLTYLTPLWQASRQNLTSCSYWTIRVRNISFRPLDQTETRVLSYGLKHSVTPRRIPTESIVSRVEAVLSRQRDLSETAKDNISSSMKT